MRNNITIMSLLVIFSLFMPELAFAEELKDGLENVKDYLTGDVAGVLAILAVVFWGINMLTNWISVFANLRSLVVICLGILIIFGAGDFVGWIKG